MERFSDVSGMPVVCIETGEVAGTVEAVVCKENDKVSGFLLDIEKIGNRYGFVHIEDIVEAGRGILTVFNEESILRNRNDIKNFRKTGNWNGFNKKVISENGKLLGTVKDGIFDINSGKISEIELSLGVIEDLRNGRRRFKIKEDTEFGEEFIVLKNGGKNG